MAPTDKRSYTSGHFLFNIDDSPAWSWLKSVDGGVVKGNVVTENVGPDTLHFKHITTVEIEPLSVEVGMSASSPMFRWIQDSWKRQFSRRNGSIVHANFRLESTLEQWFTGALIVETVFPTLDASDKSPAYLSVKLKPEYLEIKKSGGEVVTGVEGSNKQKMWLPSMFRVNIDGIDCTRVNKVESFTVKQKIKEMYIGNNRYPELEPTGIEFPNLVLTLPAAFADDFITWHQKFVVMGARDNEHEKQGSIEFLDPAGGKLPIFTVDLKNVGINSLAIEKSEAKAEQIKRCKAELYVESMELKYGLGLE
ncbi:MAG: phage tail protein [Proteobacteria bacterium]|nr:phage tail protein [Pseudomonadota bacterium]